MAPASGTWRLARTFDSASGQVRWDELGDPAGEPVVLLHGTPFSSYVWRAVARALEPRHRVLVWDMPGYGQSEQRDGQDVSLATQGRVFADLLGEWGLAAPQVVAHDFGGRAVAGRAGPARVLPVRLIDGAGHLVQEDAPAELTAALADFLR